MQHEFEIFGLDNQSAATTATEAAQSLLQEALTDRSLGRAAALGSAAVDTATASSDTSDNAGANVIQGAVESAGANTTDDNISLKPLKEPAFLDLDTSSLYQSQESKKEVSREAKLKMLDALVSSEKATSQDMFKKFEDKMLDGMSKKDRKFEDNQKDLSKILDGPEKVKFGEADPKQKLSSEDKSELIRQKKEKLNAMSEQKELIDKIVNDKPVNKKPMGQEPFSDIYPKPAIKPTEQKPGANDVQPKPGVNSRDIPTPGATDPKPSLDRKPEAGKVPVPGAENPRQSTDVKVNDAREVTHNGKGQLFDLGNGADGSHSARLPDGSRITTSNEAMIVEQGGVRTKVNSDGSMTITQNGQELRLSTDQAREELLDKNGSRSFHYSDGSTVTRRQVLRNATELALTLPDGTHYSINPANPQKLEFVRGRR